MDQEKIGKLIATLRKKHNLTQSELGAKVGVGDRAVSKWERGLTCPDISIINDLSKILGITTDELLSGELSDKELMKEISSSNEKTSKFNKKLLLIPIVIILILVGLILYINYNKSDVYTLKSASDEYDVVGKVIFKKNKMSLVINQISYKNKAFSQTKIRNYDYSIKSGETLLYKVGGINDHYLLIDYVTIDEFGQMININYDIVLTLEKKDILHNNIVLIINYLDENEHIFNDDIKITLHKM